MSERRHDGGLVTSVEHSDVFEHFAERVRAAEDDLCESPDRFVAAVEEASAALAGWIMTAPDDPEVQVASIWLASQVARYGADGYSWPSYPGKTWTPVDLLGRLVFSIEPRYPEYNNLVNCELCSRIFGAHDFNVHARQVRLRADDPDIIRGPGYVCNNCAGLYAPSLLKLLAVCEVHA